jgi:MerR family transcriptional regulator, light-induced transcriptional regulator
MEERHCSPRSAFITIAMSDILTQYLKAQLAGDRNEALRVIVSQGLLAGVAPEELYLDVVGAAQAELGRLWEQNQISVADEHQGTGISHFVLAQLYPHLARAPRNGQSAVVGCIAGEMHDMPARIASDFLEAAGYDVHFLGANVPLNGLIHHLTERRPDIVAISSTMPFHFPTLQRGIDRVRQALGDALFIIVGGLLRDAAPRLAPELQVRVSVGTARDLVALCRRLPGAPP